MLVYINTFKHAMLIIVYIDMFYVDSCVFFSIALTCFEYEVFVYLLL